MKYVGMRRRLLGVTPIEAKLLAGVWPWIARVAVRNSWSSLRQPGAHRRRMLKSAQVISVSDIQMRPDSAFQHRYAGTSMVLEGQIVYPSSPLELAVRRGMTFEVV